MKKLLLLSLFFALFSFAASAQTAKFKAVGVAAYDLKAEKFTDVDEKAVAVVIVSESLEVVAVYIDGEETLYFDLLNVHKSTDGTEKHYAVESDGTDWTTELIYNEDDNILKLKSKTRNVSLYFLNPQVIE